jgi:tRNA/rRNA methyltransferase
MSGTDTTQQALLGGPAIILVDPQLGQNIGMVARAMLNCGLEELRLVRPRDGWPNSAAESAASGADAVLEKTRLFDTTAEAVADLARVYATTARPRGMITTVVTPRQAAAELRSLAGGETRAGVIFGPERSGLVNDDIALADAVLSVPLNPAFASLNLAQAVFVVGYEWLIAGSEVPARELSLGATRPATKGELIGLFERLEAALDARGFLYPVEKRPTMVRNLRNLFQRAELTEQEVRTLHGIVSLLNTDAERDED